MKKKIGIIKKFFTLLLVILINVNCFAEISNNDGSAFITKAEFDALKSSFQAQIDGYNQNIDSKIDGAIASYLAGIKVQSDIELKNLYKEVENLCPGKKIIFKTEALDTNNTSNTGYGLVFNERVNTGYKEAVQKQNVSDNMWITDSPLNASYGAHIFRIRSVKLVSICDTPGISYVDSALVSSGTGKRAVVRKIDGKYFYENSMTDMYGNIYCLSEYKLGFDGWEFFDFDGYNENNLWVYFNLYPRIKPKNTDTLYLYNKSNGTVKTDGKYHMMAVVMPETSKDYESGNAPEKREIANLLPLYPKDVDCFQWRCEFPDSSSTGFYRTFGNINANTGSYVGNLIPTNTYRVYSYGTVGGLTEAVEVNGNLLYTTACNVPITSWTNSIYTIDGDYPKSLIYDTTTQTIAATDEKWGSVGGIKQVFTYYDGTNQTGTNTISKTYPWKDNTVKKQYKYKKVKMPAYSMNSADLYNYYCKQIGVECKMYQGIPICTTENEGEVTLKITPSAACTINITDSDHMFNGDNTNGPYIVNNLSCGASQQTIKFTASKDKTYFIKSMTEGVSFVINEITQKIGGD